MPLPLTIRRRKARVQGETDPWIETTTGGGAGYSGVRPAAGTLAGAMAAILRAKG